MKHLSQAIDDKWLRVWAIPVLAIISTIFFTKEPIGSRFFCLDMLSFTIGLFIVWETNRAIILYSYKYLPERKDLKRRLSIQLLVGIIISMAQASVLFLFHTFQITGKAKGVEIWDLLNECREILLPTFMVVLCLNAFYENFFLNQLWQQSIIEAGAHKKASLEARFQNLKNQVNPHFLFNSFNTLANLIEEKPTRAISFVEKLSEVYRYVLNSKNKEIVSLQTELEFVQSYIFLLKMRFEENLHVNIQIPPTYMNRLIPPLTLQMLVENAIKHNEIASTQPLHISLAIENDMLIVKNSLFKKISVSSTGVGLENIRQRYQFLSSQSVQILENNHYFTVRLPLLSLNQS